MKLDRRAVERLLALNDAQLKEVMLRVAGERGIDLSGVALRPDDIAGIRRALQFATDADLADAAAQLGITPSGGGK